MAAILRDFVVVVVAAVVVVRTRPRAIPLAMITMRKSIHGLPFLSYMSMGLRLSTLRAARAPLKTSSVTLFLFSNCNCRFSHKVPKFQTTKLLNHLILYFHDVLEQLKTNIHTNFCSEWVLGFVIGNSRISKPFCVTRQLHDGRVG